VLHRVGEPVHVTTRRRLAGAVTAGESNIVVMLTGELDLDGFEDWSIWWGANLGADGEELVTGRVGEVLPQILAARARAKAVTGWVMDAYLLRRDR
jgi:precorrin-6A synthase